MIVQGNVGQPASSTIAPGTPVTARLGGLADLIITELQGRYFENVYRGNVFTASQAAVGSTIIAANVSPVAGGAAALFTLYNVSGNTKNAVILRTVVNQVSGTPGGGLVFNVIPPPCGITAAGNIKNRRPTKDLPTKVRLTAPRAADHKPVLVPPTAGSIPHKPKIA